MPHTQRKEQPANTAAGEAPSSDSTHEDLKSPPIHMLRELKENMSQKVKVMTPH